MKKDIHPSEYRLVVIQDTSDGESFLTRSTAATDETIKWKDGQTYPLVKIHVSASSHPFYTGKEKLVDIEGRVDKFKARRAAADKMQAARQQAIKKRHAKPLPAKQEQPPEVVLPAIGSAVADDKEVQVPLDSTPTEAS